VVEVPFGGGQLVLKWNPVTEKFVIQVRATKGGKPDDDEATASTCCHVIDFNPIKGLELKHTYNEYLFRIERTVAPTSSPIRESINNIWGSIANVGGSIWGSIAKNNDTNTNQNTIYN